jgi:hypothetical protein
MNMKTSMRTVLAVALAAAAAGCSSSAPSPSAPDKVVLRVAPTPGLAFTHERTEKVTGWLSVKADGAESRQPLVKDERRVYEDEVLEVEGSHVVKLRRKNVEWDLKRQAPGDAAMTAVPMKCVGKTIVLRRTDLGTEYEQTDGLPEQELRANVLGTLEALVSPPAEAVAVGAEWPIDGDRIVEMFGGEGGGRALKVRSASGVGRLDALEEGRFAKVTVKLTLGGSFRSLLDVDVTMDLTAHVKVDLAAGRPLAFDAHADGIIRGDVDRQGKPAAYNGEFTFDATGRNRYR